MKIKNDKKIYINKTLQFLVPILTVYGKKLIFYLDHLNRIGFGIKDNMISYEENVIHILFNSKYDSNLFNEFLIWIRDKDFYIDDYLFGNITINNYHMVVIKFPDEYKEAFINFKKGYYSKMLSKENIEKFFSYKISKAILYKSKGMEYLILKEIEKTYGEKNILSLEDIINNKSNWEWCLPPFEKDECFNK